MKKSRKKNKYVAFFNRRVALWRNDIALFAWDNFRFVPDEWQWKGFKKVQRSKRVSIKSGQGVGKTAWSAIVFLWFLTCFTNARVVATAPTRQQLNDVLWAELEKWRQKSPLLVHILKWTKTYIYFVGREKRWFGVARASSKPENMQGFHEDNMLFIIDEASGVDEAVLEAIRGTLTGLNNKLIFVGNPTQTSGMFYDSHNSEKANWDTMTVDAEKSKRTDKENIEALKRKYGADSNVVRVRVHGLFPLAEDDVFIPFSDVEKAMMLDFGEDHDVLMLSLGVDVARFGDDETVVFSNASNLIKLEHRRTQQDLMVTTGIVVQKYKELAARYPDYHGLIFVYIDDTGMGGGVTDRLREVKYEEGLHRMVIVPVNFASSPPEFAKESYTNISGYMWGVVKELLRQRELYLPNDEELSAQLTTRKYTIDSKGKIKLESKEDMKKRQLPSPDMGDALALSCYIANMVYIEYMLRGSLAFTQTSVGQFAKIHVGVSLHDKHAGVAFVACGILNGYRGMIVLRSEVCPNYDSEALKAGVFAFCAEVSKQYGRVDDVYVDAEEYTLQQELKKNAMRYGVSAKMRLAANLNESDLIRSTNSMFQRGMLQLTSDCRELSMAFSSAIYTEKNDKDRKVNNINLLRAFEYALERDSSRFARV